MQIFMAHAGDREWVENHTPRRCIVTRHAPVGEACFERGHFPREIWSNCCNGGVKVNAGAATAGKKGFVIIGAKCPLNIDILLNTTPCRILPPETALPRLPQGSGFVYVQAEVPEGILHDGWNNIEIFNHSDHTILDSELIWMELMLA